MIEVILLGIIVIGIVILIYQNIKKNETKSDNEDEIGKLTKMNKIMRNLHYCKL